MTRIKLRAAIAATLIAFGFLRTTHALTLEWSRTLGTSQEDVSYGIAADGLGNFYVTGATTGSLGGTNSGDIDAFVSKYNELGTLQWTRQFGSAYWDASYGVAADRLGNVLIAGRSNELDPLTGYPFHGFVTNLDAAGNVRWSKLLSTPRLGDVEAHGVATDGLGNVYVTGRIACCSGGNTTFGHDIFLSKFDSAGNLQWTRQQDGNFYDEAFSGATDGLGNVYVGGILGYQALVSKYNESGDLLWRQHFDIDRNLTYVTSISADELGNIYVAGGEPFSIRNYHLFYQFVRKYDASGTLVWHRQLEPVANDVVAPSTTQHESGLEVTSDGLGNAYVTGYVWVSRPGQSGYYEAFVSKYDAQGNHLETTLLGSGTSDNVGLGIVADGVGNVYITGQTNAILTGSSQFRGDANAFIAKFRDEAVPEPAGILLAVIGGSLMPYLRRPSASRRDAATCGRVSPRLARNVVG